MTGPGPSDDDLDRRFRALKGEVIDGPAPAAGSRSTPGGTPGGTSGRPRGARPRGPAARAVGWSLGQAEAGRLGLWIGVGLLAIGIYLVLEQFVPAVRIVGSLGLAIAGGVLLAWVSTGRAGGWALNAGAVLAGYGAFRFAAELAGLQTTGWGALSAPAWHCWSSRHSGRGGAAASAGLVGRRVLRGVGRVGRARQRDPRLSVARRPAGAGPRRDRRARHPAAGHRAGSLIRSRGAGEAVADRALPRPTRERRSGPASARHVKPLHVAHETAIGLRETNGLDAPRLSMALSNLQWWLMGIDWARLGHVSTSSANIRRAGPSGGRQAVRIVRLPRSGTWAWAYGGRSWAHEAGWLRRAFALGSGRSGPGRRCGHGTGDPVGDPPPARRR